jgi:hypothetical protein
MNTRSMSKKILPVSTIKGYGKIYNTSGCSGTIWYATAESTKRETNQSGRACRSAVYAPDVYRHDRAGGEKSDDTDVI